MARKSRKNQPAQPAPKEPIIRTWRAGLYIRLSVDNTDKRGDSLETQRQIMESHLALFPDIEIVAIYTDNGVSGQTFERKEFQQLLEDIEAGKVDCVVVKDLSRLGRNTIDTGYYIEKYFPMHQVRFIAVNDQYDSENADNGGAHITVPLKNMINEAYAADISRKVSSQLHQHMKRGEYVGGRPPYGYKKDPNNHYKLLVDEETAPVVQQIFQWIADGVPLSEVVKRLNRACIMTPGHYFASQDIVKSQTLRGNGKWQSWSLAAILENEVYTGDLVQGKHKTVGRKCVRTPPEDWIIVQNTHEALISRELFAQVQEVRAQRATIYSQYAKTSYTNNILRGRIFCGHCGRNLHRQRSHKQYEYRCITNSRTGDNTCSGRSVYISESALFDAILLIIRREAETILGNRLRLQEKDQKLSATKEEVNREIARLHRAMASNRKYLSSLYESLINGILTEEEYRSMKTGYESSIQAALDRIDLLQAHQKELDDQLAEYICIADRMAVLEKDAHLTAALVDQMIERITFNGPNNISIQFRFESGFELVREVLDNE